jgi:hypothetical protein
MRASALRGGRCEISKQDVVDTLGTALSELGSKQSEVTYTSIGFGRLVDYPWMSQYLALAAHRHDQWDSKRGRPKSGELNKYVGLLLSSDELMSPVDRVFRRFGYRVVGVSVEKVLVGGFDRVPFLPDQAKDGLVPYDAQVRFILRPG